jgi:hypothetical protein
MAAFERVGGVIVQIVWLAENEEGQVIGERIDTAAKVYWPYDQSLLEYIQHREDEVMRSRREAELTGPSSDARIDNRSSKSSVHRD